VSALAGLIDFLILFGTAIGLVALYLFGYTLATNLNQLVLIRQNVISAALSFGLSLIGFALPLSSAVVRARSPLDCLVWGVIALAVQILVFWLVRLAVPRLAGKIAAGEIAAALFLGAASLAGGIINAAAMSL
jgi:putative membrane protein